MTARRLRWRRVWGHSHTAVDDRGGRYTIDRWQANAHSDAHWVVRYVVPDPDGGPPKARRVPAWEQRAIRDPYGSRRVRSLPAAKAACQEDYDNPPSGEEDER